MANAALAPRWMYEQGRGGLTELGSEPLLSLRDPEPQRPWQASCPVRHGLHTPQDGAPRCGHASPGSGSGRRRAPRHALARQ